MLPYLGVVMREAVRYLNNAKNILKTVPVENNIYNDMKFVREASGTAINQDKVVFVRQAVLLLLTRFRSVLQSGTA
jgi:hypothetical protein